MLSSNAMHVCKPHQTLPRSTGQWKPLADIIWIHIATTVHSQVLEILHSAVSPSLESFGCASVRTKGNQLYLYCPAGGWFPMTLWRSFMPLLLLIKGACVSSWKDLKRVLYTYSTLCTAFISTRWKFPQVPKMSWNVLDCLEGGIGTTSAMPPKVANLTP